MLLVVPGGWGHMWPVALFCVLGVIYAAVATLFCVLGVNECGARDEKPSPRTALFVGSWLSRHPRTTYNVQRVTDDSR